MKKAKWCKACRCSLDYQARGPRQPMQMMSGWYHVECYKPKPKDPIQEELFSGTLKG